jgi:hypothetical protein
MPQLVLEELEGVGAAVADVDPMAARGGRADLAGGLDPQQALAAVAVAAGGDPLAGRLAGAVVQLLTDQADQLAGLRVDGQRVVAFVAPAAAVADRPHGVQGRLVGVVQLGDVVEDQDRGGSAAQPLEGGLDVGLQDGLVGHSGLVHQAEGGAVDGRVLELLREGTAGVLADAAGGIDQPPGASLVTQPASAHLRESVLEGESGGSVHTSAVHPIICVLKNTSSSF